LEEIPYAGLIPLNCATVFFDSVKVSVSYRIGEEGKGWKIARDALTMAGPAMGAQAVQFLQIVKKSLENPALLPLA
jgi:alkylation response protein AidB-like acyl-CoA dehydrogenase